MKKLVEMKTVKKDGHHDYIYKDGKKTPIPDDGVVFAYLSNSGMLKVSEYPDIAGSIHGKFVITDEVTSKIGKPCVNGKPYDVFGIGENYVLVSNKGDKFYISANKDGSVVDHPNQRSDYFAYTLLHEIYTMLK
mgnify:FL=1